MKRSLIAAALLISTCSPSHAATKVFFSPPGGEEAEIVAAITAAKKSVFLQSYSFTSVAISNALIAANKRGLAVSVIMDKPASSGVGSVYPALKLANVNACTDAKHAISHNKIIIIDEAIVFTGSYNFTGNAEHHNAENMLEIADPAIANTYLKNFNLHRGHCK